MPGWSRTGKVFRGYYLDGTPIYLGKETLEEFMRELNSFYPNAVIVEEPKR